MAGEVIHLTNLNYQGMELNTTDISAKQSMHIDLWSETSGAVKFFLVSPDTGEAGIVLDVTGGQWNSFDIDLAAFGQVSDGSIFQMKFDSQSGAVGDATPLTDFYVDNLYFGDQTPTIGTPSELPADPMTSGPVAPVHDATDDGVVSLFSDAYTDVTAGTWRSQYWAAVTTRLWIWVVTRFTSTRI